MAGNITVILLAVIVVLLVVGMAYQAIGTARDVRRFPPPGQLVDVGGYRLHFFCVGEGSPTVILEHVGDGNVAQWGLIQPAVARETRVCAYDRAGFGWSDPGPLPRDAQQSIHELDTLLVNAAIPGPYLLVGHSYGANVVRLFAAQHPDDVAGLVLIDPGMSFDRPGVPADVNERWKREGQFIIHVWPFLTRIGLLRLGAASGALGYGDLPTAQGEAFVAWQAATKHSRALRDQVIAFAATSTQVLAAEQQLGTLPLLVLSAEQPAADRPRQVWTDVNVEIAALVPDGSHRIVPGSNHMSLVLNREHAGIVSRAILDMVQAARAD